jgi:hypothetical protein
MELQRLWLKEREKLLAKNCCIAIFAIPKKGVKQL